MYIVHTNILFHIYMYTIWLFYICLDFNSFLRTMSTLIRCRVAAYVVVNSFFMRWCRQAQTLYWFILSPKSLMIDP